MSTAVWVAAAGFLCGRIGNTAGILLAFPLGFGLIHLLPCALGGRTPAAQWRRWLAVFLLWAVFAFRDGLICRQHEYFDPTQAAKSANA